MRWVMRKKQYLGAVKAERGYLMLFTLHYAEEVLAAQELPKPEGKASAGWPVNAGTRPFR